MATLDKLIELRVDSPIAKDLRTHCSYDLLAYFQSKLGTSRNSHIYFNEDDLAHVKLMLLWIESEMEQDCSDNFWQRL